MPDISAGMKNDELSRTSLRELTDLIVSRTGLNFQDGKEEDLRRGLRLCARSFGFKDENACIEWLLSAQLTMNDIQRLASHLTIGETYFFRDKRCFEALETGILPELVRSGRPGLRVWCAGCATGEEPYSVAMLLSRIVPDPFRQNLTILATDINPYFLRKAEAGIYNDWSFRDTPVWIREKYFRRTTAGYEVLPEIKKMVTFLCHNLAEDSYPSLLSNTNAMDLIICRNVLMYFAPEAARLVIERFRRCLVEDGWLIVAPCEASRAISGLLKPVNFDDVIFYRKSECSPSPFDSWPASEPLSESCEPFDAAAPVLDTSSEPAFNEPEPPLAEMSACDPYDDALSLYEKGRYSEAGDRLTALIDQPAPDIRAVSLLCRIRANQGALAEALELSDRAIAMNKLDAASHYLRAVVLLERQAIEESSRSLKRALYLDPEFVPAYFVLGTLANSGGRHAEARRYFGNALTILSGFSPGEIVHGSDGMTAGRLSETIKDMIEMERTK